MHSIAEKDIAHNLGRSAMLSLMHDSPVASENPMISV